MNKETIQSILQQALEEEIPPSQVDLWQAVKINLVARNSKQTQQGEKMKTLSLIRIPRFALVVGILMGLLSITYFTPQGHAFARSILSLFRQVESETVPLQPTMDTQDNENIAIATIEAPSPLISAAEAEKQVNFDVMEIPFVPDGFDYLGARVYGDVVSIEYQTSDYKGHLNIKQSLEGFMQSEWDNVPAGDIVQVKIGEITGEFVSGTFVLYAGDTVATWNPDADIHRLRWVKNGISFEMTKTGNPTAIEYLDQEGLIELAEHLVPKP